MPKVKYVKDAQGRFPYCRPDVPASGRARLAFVGEAPSDTEMENGYPLVGPSGHVYNAILRAAGIDRRDVLTTNVFNIQAPDNDCTAWMGDPAFCRPHLARLEQELRAAAPTVVVPLGGTALWALTGDTGIMARRGNVSRATLLVPGTKLVPALHPAAVARDWRYFHVSIADYLRALRESGTTKLTHTRREIWIEPNLRDLANFADRYLRKCDLLSVDIETMIRPDRQVTCISFAPDATRSIVVPFVDWRKPSRSYWQSTEQELEAWSYIRDWLALPMPKLFQNGTYDVFWLWWLYGIPVMNYSEDTRLMHHVLYSELPKSLEFLGSLYANVAAWKSWREHAAGKDTKKDS